MKFVNALIIATAVLFVVSTAAKARTLGKGDGSTRVWVKIKTTPGEEHWEACRRVFQHDVHQVRRGSVNTMWCNIVSHRLYDYVENGQNFNLQ